MIIIITKKMLGNLPTNEIDPFFLKEYTFFQKYRSKGKWSKKIDQKNNIFIIEYYIKNIYVYKILGNLPTNEINPFFLKDIHFFKNIDPKENDQKILMKKIIFL